MNHNIGKVAVVGAGTMGASLAALIAGAGIPVYLMDIVPPEYNDTELYSHELRNKFAISGKKRVCVGRYASIYHKSLGDLIQVGNLEDDIAVLRDCDWVVEAVVEDIQVKKDLFHRLSPYIKETAILSTNTSGLEIRKISEVMPSHLRNRFMGTHFFNPPRFMRLFELIPGPETEEMYIEKMKYFACHGLGKGVVMAKDTPNFIANRIGAYASIATMQLTQQYGYNVPKADQLTGEVMGRPRSATFKTLDIVGLDIFSSVAQNMINRSLDQEEKVQYTPPQYVKELIDQGYLGEKTGQGFYKKTKNGEVLRYYWDYHQKKYNLMTHEAVPAVEAALQQKTPPERIQHIVWGKDEESQFAWDNVKSCLLYTAEIAQEIASSYQEIDNAMRWGYNWAMGPFEMWDAIGFEKSIERMQKEGEHVPNWVLDRLNSCQTQFYQGQEQQAPYIHLSSSSYQVIKENADAVLLDLNDGVACLSFRSKGSTVTDGVTDLIAESTIIIEEGDYQGLLIGNQNKNFCVGANLMHIYTLAQEKRWDELEASIRSFQHANLRLKYCKKPVVASPHGRTLGGGAEISMHAYNRVCTPETYMGLVELGVGLVPGGGGAKELLACSLCSSDGAFPDIMDKTRKTWETIATARVSTSAHDAIAIGMMGQEDSIAMNPDYQLSDAKAQILNLHEMGYRVKVKRGIPVAGRTGKAALDMVLNEMLAGGFITEYDAFLADKVAFILTGGNVLPKSIVSEEYLLELEREAFLSLCGEKKTMQRMEHMLQKGKPLRN